MPAEPRAPAGERMRALPYFVHNLAPGIRQTWIKLTRRKGAGASMTSQLPRLRPDDTLGNPGAEAGAAIAAPIAVVTDAAGILLGAIDRNRPGLSAVEAMNPAPQTIRPDMTRRLAAFLLRGAPYLLVTTAEGHYLGLYKT
jgi:hypothetical protein